MPTTFKHTFGEQMLFLLCKITMLELPFREILDPSI